MNLSSSDEGLVGSIIDSVWIRKGRVADIQPEILARSLMGR
jgi:hypothetical protein